MRLLRTMLVTGTAALAAGALTMTVASTATTVASGRSAHTAYRTPSVHFLAEARLSLLHFLRHNHPTMMLAPHSRVSVKNTKLQSFNWSGYAKTSTTAQAFTAVSAKWTQPKVKCGIEDQMSATWVGLDGATNGTVEQDGTTGWCFRGRATYFTWYEMFPAGSVTVGKSLKPGDKITASVKPQRHLVQADGQGRHSLECQFQQDQELRTGYLHRREHRVDPGAPRVLRPPASSRWPTTAAGRPPRWPAAALGPRTRSP